MITKVYLNRLKKDLSRIAVFSLITMLVWLALVTYRTLNKSQVKPNVKKQLEPLTATLELDTMDQVNQRVKAPAIDWASLNLTAPVVVVEEASPAAEITEASPDQIGASPSGEPEEQ